MHHRDDTYHTWLELKPFIVRITQNKELKCSYINGIEFDVIGKTMISGLNSLIKVAAYCLHLKELNLQLKFFIKLVLNEYFKDLTKQQYNLALQNIKDWVKNEVWLSTDTSLDQIIPVNQVPTIPYIAQIITEIEYKDRNKNSL